MHDKIIPITQTACTSNIRTTELVFTFEVHAEKKIGYETNLLMLGMNKAVDTIKKNNTIIEGLQKVLNKDEFNLASLFFRKCRTMYEIRKKN